MLSIEVEGARKIETVTPQPGRAASDLWIDWDSIPSDGLLVRLQGNSSGSSSNWSVHGRRSNLLFEPDRSTAGAIRIVRPALGGDRIDIQCRAGTQTATARLWVIHGSVRIRNVGALSSSNRNQHRRIALNVIFRGGQTTSRLGLFSLPNMNTRECVYGAMIEAVGCVDPWDTPAPFHMVRRVVSCAVSSTGAYIAPRTPGDEDTTDWRLQDQSPNSSGHVYDIDAPGWSFTRSDAVGTTHKWNVTFDQYLVIGRCPSRDAWHWASQNERVIGRPQRWRANYTASVVSAGAPPTVSMNGFVGECR